MLDQLTIKKYVKNYFDTNPSLHYKNMCPQVVALHVACEVADQILHDKHPDVQHLEANECEDHFVYTETSQNLFNKYYDLIIKYLEPKILI
jgi:hypothetical protein